MAFRDRIAIRELDVATDPVAPVDIALFDAYGHARLGLDRVRSLAQATSVGAVVVYTNEPNRERCAAALDAGARAVLPKSLRAGELAEGLLAIADGNQIVSEDARESGDELWPGRGLGLTARESEVAALLTQGLRNKEIAEALWISEHTVKTHMKAIFQKAMVTSRAEAIVRLNGDAEFERRRSA